jgi:mannose-6-phosphate isomerase-like protein (cupin superfamily)
LSTDERTGSVYGPDGSRICERKADPAYPQARPRKEQLVENVERGATQVASGEGKTLWVLGDLYEFKATGEDTGGTFALWETPTPPGNPGPPPHIHHNDDEVFYLLEGKLELMVEGRANVVGAGSRPPRTLDSA